MSRNDQMESGCSQRDLFRKSMEFSLLLGALGAQLDDFWFILGPILGQKITENIINKICNTILDKMLKCYAKMRPKTCQNP